MVLTNFNGVGVGFGFGVGCGFGVGWGFGGMPLNVLGIGAGGGCGVGLGLGWGFGSAFGSKYISSAVTFPGVEFSRKVPIDETSFAEVNGGNAMDEGERLCDAARNGDVLSLRAMADSGVDVSFFDAEGLTPLMHAAKHGHAEAVKVLLEAGAPWNALSRANLSAGDYAMDAGHQEVFDILLNAGIQAEFILGTIARKENGNGDSNGGYLEDRISFSEDKLMDIDSKAIMMAWEKPLMEAHAKAVCSGGGRILNIGFGMGLVDTAIQQYAPDTHTIVEAHPEVYERMVTTGWAEKKNVKLVFGRWQDVLSQLESYDGIFFDTYGEYYEDLREFHKHLPKLLKPGGIYSFFNGLCGDNAFFHVVYCHLVSLELENVGYSTQLIPLPVKECLPEEVWKGVKHKYWELDVYYLPVCQSSQDT